MVVSPRVTEALSDLKIICWSWTVRAKCMLSNRTQDHTLESDMFQPISPVICSISKILKLMITVRMQKW